MQRQIKFTKQAFSSTLGTFGQGDIGWFPPEVARHFVEDAQCAEFTDVEPREPAQTSAPAKKATNSKKVKP